MASDDYEYVKVSIQNRTICNNTDYCGDQHGDVATITCAIQICASLNGTVPKYFTDIEIELMRKTDVEGRTRGLTLNENLQHSRFWLDLRQVRNYKFGILPKF